MNIAVAIAVVLVTAFAVTSYTSLRSKESSREPDSSREAAWAAAVSHEQSQIGRILIGAARPLANLGPVAGVEGSPTYQQLNRWLMGSGGVYGASPEVFLSALALHVFTAAVGLLVTFAFANGIGLVAATIFCIGWTAYPWDRVRRATRERAEQIAFGLPEFCDLLQMPLGSGSGVKASMRYTAERLHGLVAAEVLRLLRQLESRAMSETEAYQQAGYRLGTPEAIALFNTLMQADLEGTASIKSIQVQSEALRNAAHQRRRGKVRQLPVKLVLIVAVHFIPALFVLILIPTLVALTHL